MKKSKKQLIKNAKGITLVALVVTIVMMLILVGITMVAVLGDNGVISKAKIAGNKYEKAEIDEIQYLNELSNLMHNYISKDNSESSNKYKFTIRFEDNDKNLIKFEKAIICIYSNEESAKNKDNTYIAQIGDGSTNDESDEKSVYLQEGIYWLSFKAAPSGYNKPSNVTKIEVKSNNENTLVIKLDNKFKVTIKYRDNNENPIKFGKSVIYIYNNENSAKNGDNTYIAQIGDKSINNENDEESIYLPIGVYWLSLIAAPSGYNKPINATKIEVKSDGENELVVHLSSGSMLPFT